LCHLSFICRKFNFPRLTGFVDLEGKKHACVYIVQATGHTCNTQLTLRLYWFRIGNIPFVPNSQTSYFAIKLTNIKSERFSISCKLYCLTGEIYCWSGAILRLSNICCYGLVEKCSDSGTYIFTFTDFLFGALLCQCFHNQRDSTFHLTFIYLVKKRDMYKFRTTELHLIWIFFSALGSLLLYPIIAKAHCNFISAGLLSFNP